MALEEESDRVTGRPQRILGSRSPLTQLVAADESGLPATFAIALVLVAAGSMLLDSTLTKESWTYQFFFKRSFVQWVLLGTFSVGLVHLARRIPEWLREKAALRNFGNGGEIRGAGTLVERRWLQLQMARRVEDRESLQHLSKSLADHDDAEVDAAYRLSTDIIQILPLIGFFGTVFGLSHGLYQSFLQTGGTTTKDFAKAIAVAFDNTLLGLALTILLFAFQSILRKREESLLLRLNLLIGFATQPDAGGDHGAGADDRESGHLGHPSAVEQL